ncbi:MAG: sugar phosphate isomerase/epimerase [Deltaproteobacteria bacterium]|nr:sugar phosphate isomerase/epimerase [Deltaproteobacteria bacterium]
MKIGIMNNPRFSVYDEIEALGKASFDFVDLTIEGPTFAVDPEKVCNLLDKHGLFAVGHTDPCLPYAYPIEAVRKACFEELERCAKLFSSVGAKVMNIHPCYYCPPSMKPDLLKHNIKALKSIAQMAGSYDLTLVLENFMPPFDRVSTFQTLLKEIPELQVHLDFGHTNMGRDDADLFCKHLGHRIKHVHFSDNRSTEDHHMPLGVGNINWENAVSELKKIRYDETITLEVFCNNKDVLFQYLDISRRLLLELWNKGSS